MTPAGNPFPENEALLRYAEHTARVTRELISALVTEDDVDALAGQVAEISARLAESAADPRAVALEDSDRVPNHIDRDVSPASSVRNPIAPPMRIVPDGEGGFRCDLTLPLQYQGPPGRVHGGIVATMIDHLLGHAAALDGPARSMTRCLNVSYDGGTPIGEPLTVRGRVARVEGRKRFMEAELICDGEVRVRAEGLWILPRDAA